ncbi:hypothetical protein AKJ66_01555 [candidate division MSBL1 archaeon SCGC-AAA259E22]|uniref:Uncharacterized protein n=1 Tax=candidate division MSBL1 archaeon SCGC-AAA259E22 TaxID=1698265 RepID=A0A133UHR3_9EURY|nr:hypothetical protein AKJ66_01555 [candidate division MSBL1 archaeon SCGC-AAA259E22]
MVKLPKDTVFKIRIPETYFDFFEMRTPVVIAFSVSRGWLVLVKSGWKPLEPEEARDLINDCCNGRLNEILGVKREKKRGETSG